LDLSVDLSFFTDGRFTKMLGLTLIFAALFMMIVAISYFSSGADDQSAIAAADGASKAKNAGGLAGALVANAFISQWLGIGSFIIIFLSGALGTALLRIRRFNIVGVTIKSLVSAIALSIVAGYISMHFVSDFPLGGMHGLYINSIVKNIGGEIGALLLSFLLVGVIAVIFIKELGTAARLAIEAYRNLKIRVATENEARRSKSQS
ncbi:MAG: DNA translocase FtsK 4TM domain-containing protein, partial [Paramuribaculum sp.]|nr:DNA translocase FtsK 4TM domain-containing protein [Paramuribaculum sp.]